MLRAVRWGAAVGLKRSGVPHGLTVYGTQTESVLSAARRPPSEKSLEAGVPREDVGVVRWASSMNRCLFESLVTEWKCSRLNGQCGVVSSLTIGRDSLGRGSHWGRFNQCPSC